jgi:ADP-heptose:LPS heptosyltransferase
LAKLAYLCGVQSVLIIQTAFLGDVVLATPVISELARIYPGIAIDVLVRKGNESLLDNNPHLRKVYILNKKERKYKALWYLLHTFRANRYDEVVNLHRFASTGLLAGFSGAPSRVGFDKNPFAFRYTRKIVHSMSNGQHEVARNLLCIAHHGAIALKRPELFPGEAAYQKIAVWQTESYFCLAPASVWYTKQLPLEKWIALAHQLALQGKVYVIGGPADETLCQQVIATLPADRCANLAGKLSLLESAALLQKATRNYVNDSGPMHLCSAMNAPVTAFYCSTVPAFGFGPLSADSIISETPLALECRPCGLHGYKACPLGHFKCGHTIPV